MSRYSVRFQSESTRVTDNVHRVYGSTQCVDWDAVLDAIKDHMTYRYGPYGAAWDSPRCHWGIYADDTIRVKHGRFIVGTIVETSRD